MNAKFINKKAKAKASKTAKLAGKVQTPSERANRNRKSRERHWSKTGVSSSTINWMKEGGWL